MNSMIQNIFMDIKSYEMIRGAVSVEDIIDIVGQIAPESLSDIHPVLINGFLFEMEFHPECNSGFAHTVGNFHYIYMENCCFTNNIYIYSSKAKEEWDDGFPGIDLLLYTVLETLCVIPCGKDETLCLIDAESEKIIRYL